MNALAHRFLIGVMLYQRVLLFRCGVIQPPHLPDLPILILFFSRDDCSTDLLQSHSVTAAADVESRTNCRTIEVSKLPSEQSFKREIQVVEFLEDEGHVKSIECEPVSSVSNQENIQRMFKVPLADTKDVKAVNKDNIKVKVPHTDQPPNSHAAEVDDDVRALDDDLATTTRKIANRSNISCSKEETVPSATLQGDAASNCGAGEDAPSSARCADVNRSPDVSTNLNCDSIVVLQCPLCYRSFDKLSTKTSHLKGCALKHKLSTQQLLEALELQHRQATERKSLGLPEILPFMGHVKKSAAPKRGNRTISKLDGNMQLAMALSLSLQDQEKAVEDSRKTDIATSASLDHFGFTSKSVLDAINSRPLSPVPRGKTKASVKKVHPLLTRTAEERQRIITEKVAMLLLEEDASKVNVSVNEVDLQSLYLQKCVDKKNLLWDKSLTSPSKNDRASYYVKDLRGFISPCKVAMGSRVMHLSQVVGRVQTPTAKKEQMQKESVTVELTSPSDEGSSCDSNFPQDRESKIPSLIEMELRAKLFNDWATMVNNSAMSDLTIYPQEGREIHVHKIILHVRCPRILRDISRQRNPLTGNEVEVVMWSKTPHAAALAFLEFVYCGSVKSIRVLSQDLSSVIWLGNHYKIADLLRYLRALTESVQTEETPSQAAINVVRDFNKQNSETCDIQEEAPHKKVVVDDGMSTPVLKESKDALSRKLFKSSLDANTSPVVTPPRSETESIYSETTLPGAGHRSPCSSPDMFADEIPQSSGKVLAEENSHSANSVFSLVDTVRNYSEDDSKPSSQCASISSEKTVVYENNSPTHCDNVFISSEKADTIGESSKPPSPTLSNASAATELLECNQGTSARFSLNDSKRKLSYGSEDGNVSASKRPCPKMSSLSPPSGNESIEVECFDLTQDSDSNASFPVVSNNFSDQSGDRIFISSENEISDSDAKSEQNIENSQSSRKEGSGVTSTAKHRKGNELERVLNLSNESRRSLDLSNENTADLSPSVKNTEPYVSPVWDGFEDIHYEARFSFPHSPTNSGAQPADFLSPEPDRESSTSSHCSISKGVPMGIRHSMRNILSPPKNRKVSNGTSDSEMAYQSPKTVASKSQSSASANFDALLDESLNISDTLLQQAECGKIKPTQRETKGTPVNRILTNEQDRVTPLMNYSAMKTPELKRELQKFGLKPTLGKRKGKIMLRHIYNELHPWVPADSEANFQDTDFLSQPSSSSNIGIQTCSSIQPNSRKLMFSDYKAAESDAKTSRGTESSSDSDDDRRSLNSSRKEIQYLEEECDDGDTLPSSQPASKIDLPRIVSKFIRNDKELHKKVLEYEPILIEKLQTDLRDKGFKFKMADLMTFLDEKCVTFKTSQSGSRTKKRKQKSAVFKKSSTAATGSDTSQLSD